MIRRYTIKRGSFARVLMNEFRNIVRAHKSIFPAHKIGHKHDLEWYAYCASFRAAMAPISALRSFQRSLCMCFTRHPFCKLFLHLASFRMRYCAYSFRYVAVK